MSPLKSSFVCLSLLLSLMVYAVLSLFAMSESIIFKGQTIPENETNISDTTSTDGTVLRERSSEEEGPEGGGGKQGNDGYNEVPVGALHRDKDVSSQVALLFIQACIYVTKY